MYSGLGSALELGYRAKELKKKFKLFLERGKGGRKRGRERHQSVASHMVANGDQTCKPGMCPDQESNQ